VIGGTAWDFTNRKRIAVGSLDLLVIDEAGQFSLANTVAVSTAAHRLLLLGDPQQLPQVSQGTHPEPCDSSALAWTMGGHRVMPADRGYFLDRTWRMHPDLTRAVSRLAYEDRLQSSEAVTGARSLAGVAPGIGILEVDHADNSVESPEEALAVIAEVQRLLGREWSAPETGQGPRPLEQNDVLVVAPYNAQVALVRRRLDAAGLADVRVGSVDKFQGQEAPVVIVSMTASAPADVPRGMDFLLSRNRVNVAVSRAMWCAVIVRSPRLTDYLPADPIGLARLGAFIGLCAGPTEG
jgi:superfamily I DNA and/or RNA helicase